MRLAPVPELIYLHCPKLKQDAGLLIEAVHPGGPAEKAGLAPGEIIAGTEQQWIYSPEELPELAAPQALIVLQAGKLCKVVVQPLLADEQADEATAGAAAESADACKSACDGCQAISMACVNGRYQIEAAYTTPQGPCKVQLNGTRAEIEKSLALLPPAVKQAIESRLDRASP
jgi:hypothetical protein